MMPLWAGRAAAHTLCASPPQIVYEFLLRYVVSNDTDAKVGSGLVVQDSPLLFRCCWGGGRHLMLLTLTAGG